MQTDEVEEKWDIEIKPKPKLLDIDLREIWKYRDLVTQTVRKDFVSAYKQTVIGPLWHLVDPLITTLTYVFIFGAIAGISTDGLPRILFYLPGIILWTLFSNSLLSASSTFSSNAGIFGKVYFPRLTMPIASAINSYISFGFQFLFFLVLVVAYLLLGADIRITWYALLTPMLAAVVTMLGIGLGTLLAPVTTRYRDLSKLLSASMRILMFATPIIYPLSKVYAKYPSLDHISPRWFVEANPMTTLVEVFRYIWLGTGSFTATHIVYVCILTAVALFLGVLVFNRSEKMMMDMV